MLRLKTHKASLEPGQVLYTPSSSVFSLPLFHWVSSKNWEAAARQCITGLMQISQYHFYYLLDESFSWDWFKGSIFCFSDLVLVFWQFSTPKLYPMAILSYWKDQTVQRIWQTFKLYISGGETCQSLVTKTPHKKELVSIHFSTALIAKGFSSSSGVEKR